MMAYDQANSGINVTLTTSGQIKVPQIIEANLLAKSNEWNENVKANIEIQYQDCKLEWQESLGEWVAIESLKFFPLSLCHPCLWRWIVPTFVESGTFHKENSHCTHLKMRKICKKYFPHIFQCLKSRKSISFILVLGKFLFSFNSFSLLNNPFFRYTCNISSHGITLLN